MSESYVCARPMKDANGNWYYLRMSDSWASEELARRWAQEAGLGRVEIVPVDQRRLFDCVTLGDTRA